MDFLAGILRKVSQISDIFANKRSLKVKKFKE